LDNRILIIDDAKNIRMMLSKCLSGEGFTVDTAKNGFEGIELFKKNNHPIVILDIRLPNLSGTEVLKELKHIKSDVTVIIITAFPTVKNAIDCIKLGAVDYLRKPFTPDKIKNLINTIISRKNIDLENADSYESLIQYSKKCIIEGDLDKAIECLKKSFSLNIEDAGPFILLGSIFELKGEPNNAKKYYKIALQLEPGSETVIEALKRLN